MEMDIEIKTDETIGELLHLKEGGILKPDPEYQRPPAWSKYQQQFFIDSIFRGYPVPAFYLHDKTINIRGRQNTTLWIVDGQQRINAIYKFVYKGLPLLNSDDLKFPNFIKDEKSFWEGKRFDELTKEEQKNFCSTEVVTYTMTTDNDNRIRDLFIRLQGGVALTPQDKRDSWPGDFTKFVLVAGGKSEAELPGWPFFKEIPKISSESKRRSLVAQCYMLFQKNRDEKRLCDIKSISIDDYYHTNVGFDNEQNHKERFRDVCDRLYTIFKSHPKINSAHYVIHLFLFMDSIIDKAIPSNFDEIPEAFKTFKERVQEAKNAIENNDEDYEHKDYYHNYGYFMSSSSDIASSIQRRHSFFIKEMENLANITHRDSQRILSDIGKESVYYRDNRKCQICRMRGNDIIVGFSDAQFHHIKPHAEGGRTSVDNHVTVHRECHPRGSGEEGEFRRWWEENKFKTAGGDTRKKPTIKSKKLPSNGTKLRYLDPKYPCQGEIIEGQIHITINGSKQTFNAFSPAAQAVSGVANAPNGWLVWEVKTPDSDEWLRADRWRDESNP